MPRITFEPAGLVVEAAAGESVFDAGRRAGLAIATACGGRGTCGLCRVAIVDGDAGLPPLAPEERRHLGDAARIARLRLACRLRPTGDLVVRLR